MSIRNLSGALMAFGLLAAVPAFAQTPPVAKQPTQEGGGPSMPMAGDPNYKQKTQEGGPTMPLGNTAYKQPTQEGGPSMPMAADPNYKQK